MSRCTVAFRLKGLFVLSLLFPSYAFAQGGSIDSIDKWWGYTRENVVVTLSVSIETKARYVLDVDVQGLFKSWKLKQSFVRIDGDPDRDHRLDRWGSAKLRRLRLGSHTLTIYSFTASKKPIIERITFKLELEGGNEVDRLNAMFIADRPGLTDGDVASFEFVDGDGDSLPGLETVQDLVDAFAPTLFFTAGENYFPQSIETTLAEERQCEDGGPLDPVILRDGQGVELDRGLTASELLEASGRYGSDEDLDDLFLDLPCDGPIPVDQRAGDDPFPLYATALLDDDQITISYWIHYGYSNWKQHGGHNNHESDWEGGTVYLKRVEQGGAFKPDSVAYAQHEQLVDVLGPESPTDWWCLRIAGGERAHWLDLDRSELILDRTHPSLYVGLGGHASYFSPGSTCYWIPDPSRNCALPYERDEVHTGDETDTPQQGGVLLLPRVPDVSSNNSPWLAYPGHWGRKKSDDESWCEGAEGPIGPVFTHAKFVPLDSPGDRWFDPVGWPEDAFDFGWWAPGDVDCELVDQLKATCIDGGATFKVKATLRTALPPGTIVRLALDRGDIRNVRINSKGKATASWRRVQGSNHEVCVLECPDVCQTISCGPPDENEMVLVPAGEFAMGCHAETGESCESDEDPVHDVYVDSFLMDVYEVTNLKYAAYLNSAYGQGLIEVRDGVVYKAGDSEPYCVTTGNSMFSRITWDGSTFGVTAGKEDHPMVMVLWYGTAAYANWRSAQDGRQPCYDLETWECDFEQNGYRLPTEAEWEYAARGGEHDPYYAYPWGNDIDGSKANYWQSGDPYETGDYPWTARVGYYDGNQDPPGDDMVNGYGLYDMSGNAWEWCNDWYDSNYYDQGPPDNPKGPSSGTLRVIRGGSWWQYTNFSLRCAERAWSAPGGITHDSGFRVVAKP